MQYNFVIFLKRLLGVNSDYNRDIIDILVGYMETHLENFEEYDIHHLIRGYKKGIFLIRLDENFCRRFR